MRSSITWLGAPGENFQGYADERHLKRFSWFLELICTHTHTDTLMRPQADIGALRALERGMDMGVNAVDKCGGPRAALFLRSHSSLITEAKM